MPMESLVCANTTVRVSSVLNRDVTHYGKQHLLDGNEETCWISEQLNPFGRHWIILQFPHPVKVSQFRIQFQGGFTCQICTVDGYRGDKRPVQIGKVHFQNNHAMQTFQLEEMVLDKLKITFQSFTDFFGRMVVYHLGVLGERLEDKVGSENLPQLPPKGAKRKPRCLEWQ